MDQDRRTFLGQTGKLLVLTASAAIAWEHVLAGRPEDAPNFRATDHWWGMSIDIEKCIGCGTCVRACKTENDVLREEFMFRTWVERYVVDPGNFDHPKVDSRNGGYDGFHEREVLDPNLKVFFVPKLCNHCTHSPCVQVCPVGATFESPDGVVLVDKTYCLGCRYCVQACPYGCRFIDPRTETVDKCTLCYHRITRGLTTACAETCPTGSRVLADLKDPKDPIHAFLRENMVQVLKPQMATGSRVFYNGLDGSVR
jgi:Fe-S-cluster-containing dehydrogenase component